MQKSYSITEAQKAAWRPLPRDKYPKPLVFHDGRLAFTPTPTAAVAMYAYLPLAILLGVLRCAAFVLLPYSASLPLCALTGLRSRLVHSAASPPPDTAAPRGRLFVCNHRTLLDPVAISGGLNRPVIAVTYGLSWFTELISPIPTARLAGDRRGDRRRMASLLARGDLVVCPEGTTCREPYLLRFSPLFAELAGEVTPVALCTRVDTFYGTSTRPAAKWLDLFYFLMNMRPEYPVEFLEPVATTAPTDGGGAGEDTESRSIAVANRVQRVIGEALGFELTGLTRKDKYTMLTGDAKAIG